MFRCEGCARKVGPKVPTNKVVVEKRDMIYENVHPLTGESVLSRGWEIVKELVVGPCCLPRYSIEAAERIAWRMR